VFKYFGIIILLTLLTSKIVKMNKFKYIILTLSALLIWSCGSDFVPPHESVQQGGFIKFDEQRVQNVDVTNNSSAFDATVSDQLIHFQLN